MTDERKPKTFFIDDREIDIREGESIFRAARRLDIKLPHLCYSPKPGYRADGNCRVCMVEIEGERVLAASCIRQPSPGMKVKTATERAKTARKMVAELLVTDQPAMALGGYQGWDHVVSVSELQQMIGQGEISYFYLPGQGGFSRGGSSLDATSDLTAWVRQSCAVVPPEVWTGQAQQTNAGGDARGRRQAAGFGGNGLQLYQCGL